jgi:hypothetical protein
VPGAAPFSPISRAAELVDSVTFSLIISRVTTVQISHIQ